MQTDQLGLAKVSFQSIENHYQSRLINAVACADQLTELLMREPALTQDEQIYDRLENLLDQLYESKNLLSEKECYSINRLFFHIYHINTPTLIAHFWNSMHLKKDNASIYIIENRISDFFHIALLETPLSPQNLETIDYYKKNLKFPIKLDLSGLPISDDKLSVLDGLPIYALHLLNCQYLTSKALELIEHMPQIKSLRLGSNRWVDDRVLAVIPPNIENLSLAACPNFSKQGLLNLESSSVSSLDLFGCKHLSDEEWATLPDTFKKLDLYMCQGLGPRTFEHLSEMKNLRELGLANVLISDEQAAFLPKQLESLDLSSCCITDKGLESISRMTNLHELFLSKALISDKGLQLLPTSLKRLYLVQCDNISDQGVLALAQRLQLNYLNLFKCKKITASAVDKLIAANVKVEWLALQPARMARLAFKS